MTDTDREAELTAEAERRWSVMVTGYTDGDGERFEYASHENRRLREAFFHGAGFRRGEPNREAITAEMWLEQVNHALWLYDHEDLDVRGVAAALSAALSVGKDNDLTADMVAEVNAGRYPE